MRYLVLLFTLIFSACGLRMQETDEDRFDSRLRFFESYIVQRSGLMKIAPPLVRVSQSRSKEYRAEIWINELPKYLYPAAPRHVLSIFVGLLREAPEAVLEHAATHELCHIKLRHVAQLWGINIAQEDEAEQCAYDAIGEDTFGAAKYYYLQRDLKNSDIAAFSLEELKIILRTIYKKERKE